MRCLLITLLLLLSFSAFTQRTEIYSEENKDDLVSVVSGFEPHITSHYVIIPTFGKSEDGATGWRMSFGGKYYFHKKLVGEVALIELSYQRIGNVGYHDDYRIDNYNFLKTFGFTAGLGENLGAGDIFIVVSLGKTVGDNIDAPEGFIETGIVGILDVFEIGDLEIGGRFDFKYQAFGGTSLRNAAVNFPFRMSGGIYLSYEISKVYAIKDPRHY